MVARTPCREGRRLISHVFSLGFYIFGGVGCWRLLQSGFSPLRPQQLTEKQKTITSTTSSDRLRLFSYFPWVLTEIEEAEEEQEQEEFVGNGTIGEEFDIQIWISIAMETYQRRRMQSIHQ